MSIRSIVLWICCLFLIVNAVFSLTGSSYIPTHDGEYHIIRIVEFSKMLRAGYLFPRWAPDLNSGYGIPIFQYHYPLPNYIGSILRFVAHDAVYAFQWSLVFAYIAVVIGFFYWLSCFYSIPIAFFGSVIGSYTPYLFLDIYVRGVIGEVWAIALFGFILGNIERKRYLFASLCFALLILSHNISAMIFGIYVCCYALYRHRNVYFLAIGALLASYFWIPAVFEQTYVVGLNTVNFRDHFVQLYEFLIPSWGTQFSATGAIGNKMSFQFGIIPLSISILVVIGSVREKNMRVASPLRFLVLTMFAFMLLFPISTPIWNVLFPLQFVQYPWRFLSFAIPITAFGVSYIIYKRKSFMLSLLILVSVLGLTWKYVRPVLYQPRNESYYLSRSNFTDGTSSMGNSFSTVWSSWKETRPISDITVNHGIITTRIVSRYLKKTFQVNMSQHGEVQVNTVYFPGWIAYVDGKQTEIEYKKDGIIHISVPEGVHEITIYFTETPLRLFADVLSIASLIGVLGWGILSLRNAKDRVT